MSSERRREEGDGPGREQRREDLSLSRRPLRADRRLALALLLVLLSVGAASLLVAVLSSGARGDVGPSLLQYTLLTGNVLLLFALSFYLFRYLIRLISERRAGTLGSRFKLKLVATFIGLCLVPAVALYVAAIAILNAAVDRALSPEVDRMVEDAQAVARQFYQSRQTELAAELHDLADALGRGVLVTPEHGDELRSFLQEELDARSMAAARIYFRGSTETLELTGRVAPSAADGTSLEVLPQDLEAGLARAYAGGHFELLHSGPDGLHVLAGGPVIQPGRPDPVAALLVARHVPADLTARVRRLTQGWEEHSRVKSQAPWLKAEQALLFMGFSLVIILAATWVALYIARSITVPIQRLAQGTVEVRRGNLGHEVSWQGSDELADLVTAFNEMSRDLREAAADAAARAGELRQANLALGDANEELARRRDQMERLLQTMTAGVIALDAEGRVLVVNRAAEKMLGLPPAGRVGLSHEELLAGESLAELREAVARALENRRVRQPREMVLRTETGPVHLQVVFTDEPGMDGGQVGLLTLLEDVTELVRAQKLATWQDVARRIAHEIRNPLTPIQLSAQRILKKSRDGAEDLPRVLEEGVGTIVAEVSGLKQMVDEFSRFARMPEVKPARGDLASLIRSVAALHGSHEELTLEVAIDDDVPEMAFDADLLRRAVGNLMDNAVEATGGRGHVEISLGVDEPRRVVRLVVADDGPGVPPADREKLFLPYFTTKKRGTGLGLAIVNRIVKDHDGQVRVEPNEPAGARFVVELPLRSDGEARPRHATAMAEEPRRPSAPGGGE